MSRKSKALAALLVLGAPLAVAPGVEAQADLAEIAQTRPPGAGGPTQIMVGLYVLDLMDVIGAEQSFVAQVVVRAQWNDPRLAGRWSELQTLPLDSVWDPGLTIVNDRGVVAALPPTVDVLPDGTVIYRQAYSGAYASPMDLREFPFDTQTFGVDLISVRYSVQDVELVVDTLAERMGRASSFTITDWSAGEIRVETGTYDAVPGMRPRSRIAIAFDAERQKAYYVVQVVLPLVMIVLMAGTVFWIDPTIITTRMSVVVTTMLTLIAYRFALGGHVPRLPYLTRLDFFLLGLTIMVLTTLLVMAGAAYLVAQERKEAADRINHWGRIAFPASLAVVLVVVWWA